MNALPADQQLSSAHSLNLIRALLLAFTALELVNGMWSVMFSLKYLCKGYRCRVPCLEEVGVDSKSGPIISPSQMTLGSRAPTALPPHDERMESVKLVA